MIHMFDYCKTASKPDEHNVVRVDLEPSVMTIHQS